jgi:signal transduction histidine kinase
MRLQVTGRNSSEIADAEVLRRMRIHWLSNVIHDLRGPLFAARGYARLMLDEQGGSVTVTQRKYLKSVVDNINKVSLAVSQLHHFPTDDTLDLDDFCLRDLLHDTAQGRKSSPRLRFEWQIPEEPLYTIGDRAKLAAALHKLLGAAHEFALPCGLIAIEASRQDDELTVSLRVIRDEEPDSDRFPAALPAHDLNEPFEVLRLHGGSGSAHCVPGRTCHVTLRLPLIR